MVLCTGDACGRRARCQSGHPRARFSAALRTCGAVVHHSYQTLAWLPQRHSCASTATPCRQASAQPGQHALLCHAPTARAPACAAGNKWGTRRTCWACASAGRWTGAHPCRALRQSSLQTRAAARRACRARAQSAGRCTCGVRQQRMKAEAGECETHRLLSMHASRFGCSKRNTGSASASGDTRCSFTT